MRAFSSCAEQAALGCLVQASVAVDSLVVGAQALGTWASVLAAPRLSSCSTGAHYCDSSVLELSGLQ